MSTQSECPLERTDLGPVIPEPDDHVIICRCEEITQGEIREAVHMGFWTMNEIKRFLRTGMGLCQGLSCSAAVKRIVAKERGIPVSELEDMTPRPPMRPLSFDILGKEGKES